MSRIFTIILFLSFPLSTIPQNTSFSDSTYHYLKLAKQYRINDLLSSETYARCALKWAHESGIDTLIMDAEQSLGICFIVQQDFSQAEQLFHKIIERAQAHNDLYRESRADANISIIYEAQGKIEPLLAYQEVILNKLAHTEYNLLKMSAHIHKAKAYTRLENYSQALACYEQALKWAQQVKDSDPSGRVVSINKDKHITDVKMAMASCCILQGKYNAALFILQELDDGANTSNKLECMCKKAQCHLKLGNDEELEKLLDAIMLGEYSYTSPTDHWHINNRLSSVFNEKDKRTSIARSEKKVYQIYALTLLFLSLIILSLWIFSRRQAQKIKHKHALLESKMDEEIKNALQRRSQRKIKSELLVKLEEQVLNEFYLEEAMTQEKLAERLGTNRSDLSRLINHEFKKDYRTWVNTMRIEKAKQLMQDNPDMSQNDIALQLGMAESSYFRIFKNFTDFSPGEYAQKLKEQNQNE